MHSGMNQPNTALCKVGQLNGGGQSVSSPECASVDGHPIYVRISDPPSELASSSNTLTRTSITVSRCINALAHQMTLSTELDESLCGFYEKYI